MKPSKPNLDQLLQGWSPAASPAPELGPEIWRRIGRAQARRTWLVAAAAFAVVCAGASWAFSTWKTAESRREMNAQFAQEYLHLIDPFPDQRFDSLNSELSWIQADLKLSPAQFAEIKKLHEKSLGEFLALNLELLEARREFARLEQLRRSADQIDFLAFAHLTATQASLVRRCRESTKDLVEATARVMTPGQRQRYLSYVRRALPPDARALGF